MTTTYPFVKGPKGHYFLGVIAVLSPKKNPLGCYERWSTSNFKIGTFEEQFPKKMKSGSSSPNGNQDQENSNLQQEEDKKTKDELEAIEAQKCIDLIESDLLGADIFALPKSYTYCSLGPDASEDVDSRSSLTVGLSVIAFSQVDESVHSSPCNFRDFTWEVIIAPKYEVIRNNLIKSFGLFLRCNECEKSIEWSCHVVAQFRLLSVTPEIETITRKIEHVFNSKKKAYGFSRFADWNDILDETKGYIEDDTVTVEVEIHADPPLGIPWDSKKRTNYVGLKNQGATCYMNSLLQTFYFTNELRKAVYKIPTTSENPTTSVALGLQRVFHELQFSDSAVSTEKLTKSFGWGTLDSLMQHDVQEFLRVLLEKLEVRMAGTCVEDTIPRLFEGTMESYIQCKNVEYGSNRFERFYDIQLNINGKVNIYDSFRDYVAKETLSGENQYDAGDFGLQDAEKGIVFMSFPPVLYLHLLRFQYDPVSETSVKCNDRFEFYQYISLDTFLKECNPDDPASYTLHAVLVHSGDAHRGHYVVFIDPKGDSNWCKFDDQIVSKCSKREAIEYNYGGHDETGGIKRYTSAYMLVYIRNSKLREVLAETSASDIPQTLQDKLKEENEHTDAKKRWCSEDRMYMTLNVFPESSFEDFQSNVLYDPKEVVSKVFVIKKNSTVSAMANLLSDNYQYPLKTMQLWSYHSKSKRFRPNYLDLEETSEMKVVDASGNENPWYIFLGVIDGVEQTSFDRKSSALIFFRMYDPGQEKIIYCGHRYVGLNLILSAVVSMLIERMEFSNDTELVLYEQIKPNLTKKLENMNETVGTALDHLHDSHIVVFEKRFTNETHKTPTCIEFFKASYYASELTFIDARDPNDEVFTTTISLRMTFDELANVVTETIGGDPEKLLFFKYPTDKDQPKSKFKGMLGKFLRRGNSTMPKKIYYQQFDVKISELNEKIRFKCTFLRPDMKEEETILYPNENGTVEDVLKEAEKEIKAFEGKLDRLRLTEISRNKIFLCPEKNTAVKELLQCRTRTYRIEEVPVDELQVEADEILVPCAHFYKKTISTFGTPFLLKLKQGEPFVNVKERIRKKLVLSNEEFDKFQFAIIHIKQIKYIKVNEYEVDLTDFKSRSSQKIWIGLDHIDKTTRTTRLRSLEKAVKIFN